MSVSKGLSQGIKVYAYIGMKDCEVSYKSLTVGRFVYASLFFHALGCQPLRKCMSTISWHCVHQSTQCIKGKKIGNLDSKERSSRPLPLATQPPVSPCKHMITKVIVHPPPQSTVPMPEALPRL